MITRRAFIKQAGLITTTSHAGMPGRKNFKMPNSRPLSINVNVVLDGSGAGTVSKGPTGYQETWSSITVSVHCSSNVNEATCRIYVGGTPSPQSFADGTTFGSTGDSSTNMPLVIPTGQSVWAVWSGGDAGATAYLNITGTDNVA